MEIGGEGVERPRSLEQQPHRRLARQLEQACHDAAGRLLRGEIDVELLGRGGIGGLQRHLTGLGVLTADGKIRGQRSVGEAGSGGDSQARLFAQHRRPQHHFGGRQATDLHGHRQLRHLEAFAGRRLHRCGRQRLAHHLDALGIKTVDVELALEQRQPAPDQMHPLDAQPGAFAVGNGDAGQLDVGRQRPVDGPELDAAIGRRNGVLDEADEARLVGAVVLLGGGQRQHERRGGEGGQGKGDGSDLHAAASSEALAEADVEAEPGIA